MLWCAFLLANLSWLNDLPYWFWYQIDRTLGTPVDWAVIAGTGAVVAWLTTTRRRIGFWRTVAALGLSGYVLQLALAHTEGAGLDPLRRALLTSGHRTFVTAAVEHGDRTDLLSNYIELARTQVIGQYALTKPPGQLFLYVAWEHLSRWVSGADGDAARTEAFTELAILAWPAFAMATVFPLAAAARQIADARTAVLSVSFFVTAAPVLLIQMHTDQAFYPFLVTTTLWCATHAGRRPTTARLIATGLLFACSVFCSFGLAAYLPIVVTSAAAAPRTAHTTWTRTLAVGLGIGLSVAIVHLVLLHAAGFDWLADYRIASAAHADWKDWAGTPEEYVYFAFLNTVEFTFWQGGALAATSAAALVACARTGVGRWRSALSWLGIGFWAFLAIALILGHTKAEVARLWLFALPVTCVLGAAWLRRVARQTQLEPVPARWPVWVALFLQTTFALLMKRHMDFH